MHGQRPTPNSVPVVVVVVVAVVVVVVVVVVVHEWIIQHVRFTMVYRTCVQSDTLSSF